MAGDKDNKKFDCRHELNELCCKPKARCFKGLAILSGIYTLCCALMLMIIPPVVNAHGFDKGSQVEDNLNKMKIATIICLCIFLGLTVLNLIVCKFYDSREKRHESIVNGDLITGDNFSPFNEEDDDNRHIEER